jgi:hypothetical protein
VVKGRQETKNAFLELSARLDTDWVNGWTDLADRADEEGGECRKIYNVTDEHGKVTRFLWLRPGN